MLSEHCFINPSELAQRQCLRIAENQGSLQPKGPFLRERFLFHASDSRLRSEGGKKFCKALIIGRATGEKKALIFRAGCYVFDSDDVRKLIGEPARVAASRAHQSCLGVASTREKVFRSMRSRSIVAEARPPLTRDEEHEFFADVQDVLHLENIKEALKRKLGRLPTDQEWADNIGCSVCRLYARFGKGRAARRKMIAANLPLVDSVAKQFRGQGLSHQELCQEGVLGLLKSTEKFDISHNTKFSTYSFFWICERMSAAAKIFRHIWIVGKSVSKTVSFVLQCKDEFREVHGRNPSMDELALASGIDKDKIRQAFCAIRPTKVFNPSQESNSLEHKRNVIYAEPEDPESDVLPWLVFSGSELKAELGMLFLVLSPREMQVLNMKYGLYGDAPLTLVQIADHLSVSHEAVRMAEKNALRKLRRSAEQHDLQQYLSKIGRCSTC